MKTCSICKELKPVDAFNRNRSNPDGLQRHCRICDNRYSRQTYKANPHQRPSKTLARDKRRTEVHDMLEQVACVCGSTERLIPLKSNKRVAVSSYIHNGGDLPSWDTVICSKCRARYRAKNNRKNIELGMSIGMARHRLVKSLLFHFGCQLELDKCFKCGEPLSVDDYTLEHKLPWLGRDVSLFWDVENIAFSHARCNRAAQSMVAVAQSEERWDVAPEVAGS